MKDEKDEDVHKPSYEKPELMSLNRPVKGSGLCSNGSHDVADCITGIVAGAVCQTGDAASSFCMAGTGAFSDCNEGSTPAGTCVGGAAK